MIIKTFIEPPIENNNYLIIDEESKEAALVDCSAYDENILIELKRQGAKLKYILLTHGHFDHIGGLNDLAKDVEVLMHSGDKEWVEQVNDYLPMIGMPSMEIPKIDKIVVCMGLGQVKDNSKSFNLALEELTNITGQKAVATVSRKDIANFKLRKKMPVGVMVTLRRERMYEFLEKLVRVALPRIRDFKGIESKFDGKGNYTLGIQEQIIFPEINIDSITRILGMNITFVTTAQTDEEGYALLKEFGLPFKNAKKD